MSGIGEALLSAASGGLTGLLGTALTGVIDIVRSKQKLREQQARWEHELNFARLEHEQRRDEMLIEQETKFEEIAGSVQEASYQEAQTRWSTGQSGWMIFLDVVRGIMRPMMTTYMFAFVTFIYYTTTDLDLSTDLINAALYLWITSATWWFGIRGSRAPEVSTRKGITLNKDTA